MYRSILIPTDGTEITAKAVASGIALAKALGAQLSTITVKEPFPYSAISEIALYGNGSFTVIVLSRAFSAFASSMALATAFAVISVPSVGMRMLRYMAGSCSVDRDSVRLSRPARSPGITRACDASTDRDGTRRIGRPLAPRARVERRARQPGDLHREQVVARGDARAALVHHLRGRG